MMASFQWIITLLLLLAGIAALAADPSSMQHYRVAPAPSGKDGNDCISAPCATFQHAIDLCPAGGHCIVDVMGGAYSQQTNVSHYNVILIQGPLDAKGECANPGAVEVDDRGNGAERLGAIFWVQDHAVLKIKCMTLRGYDRHSVGFAARQFAIGDVNDVNFLQFPEGSSIAASETSKVNVDNPTISGNASRFAYAADLSQITIGGRVRLGGGLRFDVAFVSALHKSVVSLYPSSIEGGEGISSDSYQCVDSSINRNIALPGGDIPYPGNFNCTILGLVSDHDPLSALRTQFDAKLRAIRAELFVAIGALAVLLVAAVVFLLILYRHHSRREAQNSG